MVFQTFLWTKTMTKAALVVSMPGNRDKNAGFVDSTHHHISVPIPIEGVLLLEKLQHTVHATQQTHYYIVLLFLHHVEQSFSCFVSFRFLQLASKQRLHLCKIFNQHDISSHCCIPSLPHKSIEETESVKKALVSYPFTAKVAVTISRKVVHVCCNQ